MADVQEKKTRSYNMSRIKGKDTKPEMMVRCYYLFEPHRHNRTQ
jgi:DNA mismatch endonuclease (patch repair protein)